MGTGASTRSGECIISQSDPPEILRDYFNRPVQTHGLTIEPAGSNDCHAKAFGLPSLLAVKQRCQDGFLTKQKALSREKTRYQWKKNTLMKTGKCG